MLNIIVHALLFDAQPSHSFNFFTKRYSSFTSSGKSPFPKAKNANVITLFANPSSQQQQLSDLPTGISPFEKSLSKSIDVQADFRNRAKPALEKAMADGIRLIEIEFPPLIGGEKVKFLHLHCYSLADSHKTFITQYIIE